MSAFTEQEFFISLDERFQIDPWTAMDYKNVLSTRYRPGITWMAPDWMGENRRRIQAYTALVAYRDNAARLLLQVMNGEERKARDNRREYGDARLLIESVRSALLGDQQTLVVEGADRYDSANPDPELKAAADRQEFLRQWSEDEHLTTKILETERNAVSLGDGLYTLGYDPETKRVTLRTWDPSCYFPVLDELGDDTKYPQRVHIAWQLPEDNSTNILNSVIRIRRITYELLDVDPYNVPWEKEQVTKACFLSDATYQIDKGARSPDDLTEDKAVYTEDSLGEIRDRNLGIDYLPVIHIPNTVAIADHFGQALITSILQILDDIQATDSDLQAASAMTGTPMLVISGEGAATEIEVGPGRSMSVGPNGSATVISGAEGIKSLQEYRDGLLKRASVNSRVPEATLGRVDPSKVKAGIILTLSFGPLGSLIEEMRLVRKDKYRTLLKFVQRFYMKQSIADGGLEGEVLRADLAFGSYIPSDRSGTVADVVALYTAKPPLISLATAIKMLQEVGVPIEDAGLEADEINKNDFSSALQLLDATGNPNVVGERLGVKVTTQAPPADPNQPTNIPKPVDQTSQNPVKPAN